MSDALGGDLLEREVALGQLDAAAQRGFAGRGRLLIVEAEAGIGKTRLLDEFCARPRRAALLRATAGQYERDLAFGVARQLLGREILGTGESPAPADVDVGAVLHDLYLRLIALAAELPLLIVVDDLHWADAPSLRLLAYLARRLEGQPLALVAAVRPGVGDLRPLRPPALEADLIGLTPLSGDATAVLLEGLLGPSPARRLAAACHQATGGNPFLLETLVRSLREPQIDLRAIDPEQVLVAPVDVESWVASQLTSLGPEAAALLDAVAILGGGAAPGILARIAGQDPATTALAIDGLVKAGLLKAEGVAFAHPLVHAAVREAMPPGARTVASTGAARVLAEDFGDVARAAALLSDSSLVGEEWAAIVLREAGELALGEGAPEEAAALWRRCLEEPHTRPRRFELTLALGNLECALGDSGGLRRLEQAQSLAPDQAAAAAAALARSRVLQLSGDLTAKITLLERSLEELGEGQEALRREIEAELGLLAVTATSVRPLTMPWLRRAIDAAEAEDPAIGAATLAAAAGELGLRGETAPALRHAHAALAPTGDARGAVAPILCSVLMIGEAWEEALGHYEAVLQDPRRSVFLAADALSGRARVQLHRGDVLAAEADARGSIELLDGHIVQPLKQAVLADALIERGAVEQALEVTAAAAAPGELDDGVLGQMLLGARLRALAACGRHDGVLLVAARVQEFERTWGIANPHVTNWREATALALSATGQPEDARALAGETVLIAEAAELPVATAVAYRTVALLAIDGPDTAGLADAAARLAETPARLEQSRTLVELGAARRAEGDLEDARAQLGVGRELAHACGASRLEQRAREELLASGARPRRVAVNGRDALTPAERRVAHLAADGLANPAIAERLVVSRRTVEMHLSNAYRKLGIASRQALASVLGP